MKHLVYKTTNLVNGMFYIGVHSCNCKRCYYLGSGIVLKNAIRKYGRSAFVRETIKEFSSREQAFEYEKKIIVPKEGSYNLTAGGTGYFRPKTKHSQETKRKISSSLKGRLCEKLKAKRKPLSFKGNSYLCQTHASQAESVPVTTLRRWLRDPRKSDIYYL